MLAILEYYTSGFWVWAGITFGVAYVCLGAASVIRALRGRE